MNEKYQPRLLQLETQVMVFLSRIHILFIWLRKFSFPSLRALY